MGLIGDLVAILPDSEAKRGKILLPDWQRSLQGEVLAVGPDATELKVRDRVTFGAAKGMESVFDGATIRVMRQDDVDMVLVE
jgi:co-chaperonin GroES (HSP10)